MKVEIGAHKFIAKLKHLDGSMENRHIERWLHTEDGLGSVIRKIKEYYSSMYHLDKDDVQVLHRGRVADTRDGEEWVVDI